MMYANRQGQCVCCGRLTGWNATQQFTQEHLYVC